MAITRADKARPEEFRIFVERFMHFMNLWTIYTDLLSGRYVPSVNDPAGEWSATDVRSTAMFILYAFFYSLVEDGADSINGFRLWRSRFPEEELAIAMVEGQVTPFVARLKLFRNRLGFHGSRSRAHESKGLELFSAHTGTEIWNAMKSFKSLGAALLAKENARSGVGPLTAEQVRNWIDSFAASAPRP
jgi:hypothetical protein